MPESTATDLIEKIKKDMQNSGFPLEFHVLNICSTKNTGRMPSLRYHFGEQEREIDLLAFFETIDMNPKTQPALQYTTTDLIIECKKRADKPWVFISTPSYSFQTAMFHLQYTSEYDLYFKERDSTPLLPQLFSQLHHNYYNDTSLPRCISYYEAFKDPNQPSDIYKSIDSVISFLLYRRASRKESQKVFGTVSEFFLPIVVLEGRLFEASISGNEVNVYEKPHIQLRTFHSQGIYIIDFVTREYFAEFFKKVEFLHEEITSAIRQMKFPVDFTKRAYLAKEANIRVDIDGVLEMIKIHAARQKRPKRKKSH